MSACILVLLFPWPVVIVLTGVPECILFLLIHYTVKTKSQQNYKIARLCLCDIVYLECDARASSLVK